MKAYDIVIVGAGPAGVSAALYSHRSGLDILVVSRHDSALLPAGKIENYYGFIDGITRRFPTLSTSNVNLKLPVHPRVPIKTVP